MEDSWNETIIKVSQISGDIGNVEEWRERIVEILTEFIMKRDADEEEKLDSPNMDVQAILDKEDTKRKQEVSERIKRLKEYFCREWVNGECNLIEGCDCCKRIDEFLNQDKGERNGM